MNDDGTQVHQISFNQSHDRDATVLTNGRVMWTRWDNARRARTRCICTPSNPDGTDLELLLRRQQPPDRPTQQHASSSSSIRAQMQDGRILALIDAPGTPTSMIGGDLVIIDATHYVENTQALLGNPRPRRSGTGAGDRERRAHDSRHPPRAGASRPGYPL